MCSPALTSASLPHLCLNRTLLPAWCARDINLSHEHNGAIEFPAVGSARIMRQTLRGVRSSADGRITASTCVVCEHHRTRAAPPPEPCCDTKAKDLDNVVDVFPRCCFPVVATASSNGGSSRCCGRACISRTRDDGQAGGENQQRVGA